ncbi:MAG: hypothetical protein ABFC77_00305 [Thermoguttaceae bacterium]
MKAHIYLLAIWLVAAPTVLPADELPVVFALSGQKVTLSVGDSDGKAITAVTLWTFGRPWGEPVEVKSGVVEITAPKVRMPVVFRVKATDDGKTAAGEVVVYPARPPMPWGKNAQFVAAGTPDWFNSWSKTVGLPVTTFSDLKSLGIGNWRMREKPALLVVGEKAAKNDIATLGRLAAAYQINVLALTTDWFANNETAYRKILISPKQALGPLADLQGQTWPLPPVFSQHVLRILNRQTWLDGPEHPFVEEILGRRQETESLRTVISYLPWQQQLGRTEMADELFLRLLAETAKGDQKHPPLAGHWRLLYPMARDINNDNRPVLAAATKAMVEGVENETEPTQAQIYVLDLRGTPSPPSEYFDGASVLKTVESRINVRSPLLILGDDPALDAWKWLKLDRSHRQSPRPGVIWRPDDSLPPSIDSQLRLMQLFTEWNISLETISPE